MESRGEHQAGRNGVSSAVESSRGACLADPQASPPRPAVQLTWSAPPPCATTLARKPTRLSARCASTIACRTASFRS